MVLGKWLSLNSLCKSCCFIGFLISCYTQQYWTSFLVVIPQRQPCRFFAEESLSHCLQTGAWCYQISITGHPSFFPIFINKKGCSSFVGTTCPIDCFAIPYIRYVTDFYLILLLQATTFMPDDILGLFYWTVIILTLVFW